jgi:hypothetical protein
MPVTVAAQKSVSFKAPFAGLTFQSLTRLILGRDGYLSGGAVSDNGTLITVQPFTVVQRGIIVQSTATITTLPVPEGDEPWYLLVAVPDDDPDSGVVVTATSDVLAAKNGTVLAFKANGVWQTPRPIDVKGVDERIAPESGVEVGLDARVVLDGDVVDQFVVGAGAVVDPDGVRRALPLLPDSTEAARFSPLAAHPQRDRIDFFALRQREPFSPELVHLQGGSLGLESGPSATVTKTTTQRLAYYAARGETAASQWFAWGDSTDLQIQAGPGGEGFAEETLLTGGDTIANVWLPGQRESDGAVLVLYTDGTSLRVASFNPATGAVVNAPVTIDTQANAITHVRGVMDGAGRLHVVFEHDDGSVQQIYYTRVQAESANFGVADVTPRYAGGTATARNDTFPSIAVDRAGKAHIVYASGTGTDTHGNFVHIVLDQSGDPESTTSFSGLTGAGYQADPNDRLGFIDQIYSDFRRPRVVVTPHDEVYAVMIGSPQGGDTSSHLLLYSPTFRARLGFDMVNVVASLDGAAVGCDLVANDTGDLRIVVVSNDGLTQVRAIGIDTVFAPDGLIGSWQLFDQTLQEDVAGTPSDQTSELLVARGPDGDFAYSFALSSAIFRKYPSFSTAPLSRTRATPHPKDVYLSGYRAPSNSIGALPTNDGRFGVFHVPPKRALHPFVVSDRGGRFHGFDGLHEAVREASREGGTIEVRPGFYSFESGPFATIKLGSHVSLRGDGRVLFEGCTIQAAASASFVIDSFAGNVLQSTERLAGILEGDVLNLTGTGGTGLHRVRRVLPPEGVFLTKILLDNSTAADDEPGGTTFEVWPTGIGIENLTLRSAVVQLSECYAPSIRGLTVVGTRITGQVLSLTDCQVPLVDNIEALGLDTLGADADTALILLDGGNGAVVRNVRMRDGDGKVVRITADCQSPHLVDVTGDRSDTTKKLFAISSGRTTPVYMTGCDGRSDDLDQSVIEPVAPVLRVSPDGGALALEDDNTRAAAGIADDRIKLTSPTAQQFNGTVADVVTGAVNQRVRTAGDTMTGNLVPNATGLDLGSVGARWDVFANDLSVGGVVTSALIPNALGVDFGSVGARWDAFIRNLDVTGVINLTSDTDIVGQLAVTGGITATGSITAGNNCNADNDVVAGGDVSAGDNIVAGGNVTAGGSVNGASASISGSATVEGNLTVNGVIQCSGNITTLNGNVRDGIRTRTVHVSAGTAIGGNLGHVWVATNPADQLLVPIVVREREILRDVRALVDPFSSGSVTLAARRRNADGTVDTLGTDTSFGTDIQVLRADVDPDDTYDGIFGISYYAFITVDGDTHTVYSVSYDVEVSSS